MGADTPIAVLSSKAEAALQLFQAELRPGHQPADRSDPRGTGDEPGLDDRPAPQPAGPRCAARTSGSKCASRFLTNARCREDPLDFRTGGWRASAPPPSTPPGRARRRRRWSVERARSTHLPQRRPLRCARRINIIILSDRAASAPTAFPIPPLLATAAVHHHLIREGLRTAVGLVVEIGRAARSAPFLRAWRAMARKPSTPISPSRP